MFNFACVMIAVRTLKQVSIREITSVFNEAFSDYFIPLQFTEESMAAKIRSEGILPGYSIGAFEEDKLVGYILHGYDELEGVKTVYNAGTGVIPSYRNRGITTKMYQYAIPLLKAEGIYHHLLEVIDNNYPAIKVYERIGFRTVRNVVAYRGSVEETTSIFTMRKMDAVPPEAKQFADIATTWQNSLASIERDLPSNQLIGACRQDELLGFAVYTVASGRVKYCAVHPQHRRKGIGSALLHFIQQNTTVGQLTATNVDESYAPAHAFLQALNFQSFLRLYEMKMEVSS